MFAQRANIFVKDLLYFTIRLGERKEMMNILIIVIGFVLSTALSIVFL